MRGWAPAAYLVEAGADIQEQVLYAFCEEGRYWRCRALSSDLRCRTPFDCGRPRRRPDQAADCAAWPRQIGRVSGADCIQSGGASRICSWLCEERKGQYTE